MAVALDTYVGGIAASGNSYTRSYTCSGSDRLLITGTAPVFGGDVSSLTYGGVALTSHANTVTYGTNHSLWSLVNPASGANNIVYTHSAYVGNFYSIASFTGVDQTTPVGSPATGGPSSGTPISTGSITCQTDGMIYGSAFGGYSISSFTINAGSILDSSRNGGGGQIKAGGYRSSTGAVSFNHGGSSAASAHGIPINPVAAAAALRPVPLTVLDAVNRASNY